MLDIHVWWTTRSPEVRQFRLRAGVEARNNIVNQARHDACEFEPCLFQKVTSRSTDGWLIIGYSYL